MIETVHCYFDVLLTVHHSKILVSNKLDAQNLVLLYVYHMPPHVLTTTVLIIRRSKLYYTASGITTLCRWPSSARVERVLSQPVHWTATYSLRENQSSLNRCTGRPPKGSERTSPLLTGALDGHLKFERQPVLSQPVYQTAT